MQSVNPFNDPDFKRQLLGEAGVEETSISDTSDILPTASSDNDDLVALDLKNIISAAPTVPKSAKNLILDASALAKNQKEEKAAEMNTALSNVFANYNEKYGTDLKIDFSNLSKTLVNVSDPETRRTLELYVSEVFRSIRPVLLLHLINKLALAIDYVTQPDRMFDSNNFTPADLFLIIEKLMLYIDQLNTLYNNTAIKDSDQVLKKIAESKNDSSMESEESRQAVNDFLALFKKDSGISGD